MYLLDTNILMELVLNQRQADEVEQLLRRIPLRLLQLSDFSSYSLGIRLFAEGRPEAFEMIVSDLLTYGAMVVLRLDFDDMHDVTVAAKQFRLGFDDAYQYVVARKHNLTVVSFDTDFDRTARGRKTPAQALAERRA